MFFLNLSLNEARIFALRIGLQTFPVLGLSVSDNSDSVKLADTSISPDLRQTSFSAATSTF
jgi:hypothetical protein